MTRTCVRSLAFTNSSVRTLRNCTCTCNVSVNVSVAGRDGVSDGPGMLALVTSYLLQLKYDL